MLNKNYPTRLEKSPLTLQQQASNPRTSVWVNASAGSGKTKVLTDRILRLLLEGTLPSQITCLTFTRTAAAEMRERLNKRLENWILFSEEELREDLFDLTGMPPCTEQLKEARLLYGKVCDSQPELALQTFHSFCQSILQRFPIETSLSPNFSLADEAAQHRILKDLKQKILENPSFKLTHPRLHDGLETLAGFMPESMFINILDEVIAKRFKFRTLFENHNSFESCLEDQKRFILNNELRFDSFEASHQTIYFSKKIIEISSALYPFIQQLESGNVTEQSIADYLKYVQALESGSTKQSEDTAWIQVKTVFLTKAGTIRSRLISKKLEQQVASLGPILDSFITQLTKLVELEKILLTWLCTEATLKVAYEFYILYEESKAQLGLIDFDDVIFKVENLLQDPELSASVLFFLDKKIDHILMDEAQDTTPSQWKIIELIVQELLVVHDQKTFFVVGDPKQSIYSFQGADHNLFVTMHDYFKKFFEKAHLPWLSINMITSYRSTSTVLATVDRVCNTLPFLHKLQNEEIKHLPFRKTTEGRVHFWPLIKRKEQQEKIGAFSNATDVLQKELAEMLANHIETWCLSQPVLPSTGLPVEPKDIMILVRRRSNLITYLTKALKKRKIPVNGQDRLQLWENLAIQDLYAIGCWVVRPFDDFALACVLKSPLIRIEEKELLVLRASSHEKTLWDTICTRRATYPKEFSLLEELLNEAEKKSPHDFYVYLLEYYGLESWYTSQITPATSMYINLFLEQTLEPAYEQPGLESLDVFLSDIYQNKDRSYPRPNAQDNSVKIMTIHGAKGRQAPIVILPDITQTPITRDNIHWFNSQPYLYLAVTPPNISLPSYLKSYLMKEEQHKINEYMRLLYVAMTRAEDHLFFSGYEPHNNNDLSWHNFVKPHVETNLNCPLTSKENKKCRKVSQSKKIQKYSKKAQWGLDCVRKEYTQPAPQEETLAFMPITSATKQYAESKESILPTNYLKFNTPNITFGTALHKALEKAPYSSDQSLEENLKIVSLIYSQVEERNAYLKSLMFEVQKLQENPDVLRLISMPSLIESTVVGLYKSARYKGRIDRLCIDKSNNIIYIIDFKTSLKVPKSIEQIPLSHQKQVNFYKSLLFSLFKDQYFLQPTLIYTETVSIFYL